MKLSDKFKTKKNAYPSDNSQKEKRNMPLSKKDTNFLSDPPKELFTKKSENISSESINALKKNYGFVSKAQIIPFASIQEESKTKPPTIELTEQTKNMIEKCLQRKGKRSHFFMSETKGIKNTQQSSLETFLKITPTNTKKEESMQIEPPQKEKKVNLPRPPKLSQTSLAIIESLRQKRKNRFERESSESQDLSRSESSFSLRFKYEELVSGDLPLPPKYKVIYNSFCSLDQMINLNKIKAIQNRNSLEHLIKEIESTTHKQFSLKTLQQILYVAPHFYIIKYEAKLPEEKKNIKDDYDLIIEIPKDFKERQDKRYSPCFDFTSIMFPKEDFDYEIKPISQEETEKRKQLFKDKLYQIVNNLHLQFLEENHLPLFDSLKQKAWHHNFDLEKCEDIPLFDIPEMPKKRQSFIESIMENDIKSQILNNAMEIVEDEDSDLNNKNDIYSKQLSKYVSSDFIQKLKLKEKVNSICSEINEYNYAVQSEKDYKVLYLNILKSMKTLFSLNVNRVSGYELKQVVEDLRNGSLKIRDSFSEESLTKVIMKMAEKYPNIIKVKRNSSLNEMVVVMNLNTNLPNNVYLD